MLQKPLTDRLSRPRRKERKATTRLKKQVPQKRRYRKRKEPKVDRKNPQRKEPKVKPHPETIRIIRRERKKQSAERRTDGIDWSGWGELIPWWRHTMR